MEFLVRVDVGLREGIADPEGATIERALPALGFDSVHGVQVGKSIRFRVDAASRDEAAATVEQLCSTFLTNPVIEDAVIEISEESA